MIKTLNSFGLILVLSLIYHNSTYKLELLETKLPFFNGFTFQTNLNFYLLLAVVLAVVLVSFQLSSSPGHYLVHFSSFTLVVGMAFFYGLVWYQRLQVGHPAELIVDFKTLKLVHLQVIDQKRLFFLQHYHQTLDLLLQGCSHVDSTKVVYPHELTTRFLLGCSHSQLVDLAQSEAYSFSEPFLSLKPRTPVRSPLTIAEWGRFRLALTFVPEQTVGIQLIHSSDLPPFDLTFHGWSFHWDPTRGLVLSIW